MVVPDCSYLISYGSPYPFSRSNPTGLFAVLQLCRHMPPSRSLTFLFPLPGILYHPPPYSRSPTCSPTSTTCLSLSLTSCFFPGLCSVLTLFVRAPCVVCLPPPPAAKNVGPTRQEFLHVVPSLNPRLKHHLANGGCLVVGGCMLDTVLGAGSVAADKTQNPWAPGSLGVPWWEPTGTTPPASDTWLRLDP